MTWPRDFESSCFLTEDAAATGKFFVEEACLSKGETWRQVLPALLDDKGGSVLCIRDGAQGTREQVITCGCSLHRAVCSWHESAWNERCAGLYLRARHREYSSLSASPSTVGLFHVLRCCWRYALPGGTVYVQAEDSFWVSALSRPFRSVRGGDQFHSN